MLHLYNSLTRKKEPFVSLKPGTIGMYVCGITVYDHCHLGHARSMVAFDVMVRYLRSQGFDVTYVRNITDIDDKIIARASERGVSIDELTAQYIDAMNNDTHALNILPPDHEPRATGHIETIIRLIQRLLEKGNAYVSENGDVCYEVDTFPEYGKLSHKDIEGLVSGSRVEIVKEKRSPLDFVLWKKAKPGEPSWPSPWGEGRPGWHIECSAMAMHELGEQFDIHGGGLDLQFPHHENEIAQSEAATGKPFANYWLHVGMLQVNGEKMAKSIGNFYTIADVLKEHHPEVIRYFLLSSHYRSPLNYSEENLLNAKKALIRLYQAVKDVPPQTEDSKLDEYWQVQFNQAMNDDFNTPVALSVLFQLAHEVNKSNSPALAHTLKNLAGILGFLQKDPESFLQSGLAEEEKLVIEQLIAERLQARAERNWAKADQIRADLLSKGIELEDGATGTTWRRIAE
ncbi:TPA: cysteine--tRNA ligase [Legionella pneumophila]|uniref:Cysteine--tRNA ligase n=3 Tax=Legionella pneumophila TaxID=446 RepID=SYC_LEGPH|nr:cysteine--tRNA ligase [Legionella pneumophila]Q5ZVY1.1 RecName: Full=Cysteine--tRNA ligase; AltName: Full=Cysteinyl-tRNA synthetase; Short=CysRS [Legionella pneumophila subsp. pneumophila str. Philadelphia 1]AAU27390.1 cysteinyl-tRNA synthetase [Legionella pneumophila subsp. pneumophila str. Philadelphia 1]AEW51511.1 cysteinyl-tRNA synthetase [Legionella pneumophila subsp. pneumophila ATCC 43290]AGN14203.1 cysteinyl-tRNA synthetase [Legionella pneumophila subsp. pneumophila str. Thunder Bay]